MMYSIHYPEHKVIQQKIMIPDAIYREYKEMPSETEAQKKRGKKFLEYHTKGKLWFTDASPLARAIETGILEANGTHICIMTKI